MTKYVENERAIEFALFGKQPPYVPRLVEDKMIRMFKQITRAYDDVAKYDRRSFLNYYYVIFKLLDLMGHRDLMKQVPLLRTPLRIKQHDIVWHQICNELGWTYKPTYFNFVRSSTKPRQGAYKKKPDLMSHTEEL